MRDVEGMNCIVWSPTVYQQPSYSPHTHTVNSLAVLSGEPFPIQYDLAMVVLFSCGGTVNHTSEHLVNYPSWLELAHGARTTATLGGPKRAPYGKDRTVATDGAAADMCVVPSVVIGRAHT